MNKQWACILVAGDDSAIMCEVYEVEAIIQALRLDNAGEMLDMAYGLGQCIDGYFVGEWWGDLDFCSKWFLRPENQANYLEPPYICRDYSKFMLQGNIYSGHDAKILANPKLHLYAVGEQLLLAPHPLLQEIGRARMKNGDWRESDLKRIKQWTKYKSDPSNDQHGPAIH